MVERSSMEQMMEQSSERSREKVMEQIMEKSLVEQSSDKITAFKSLGGGAEEGATVLYFKLYLCTV